MKANELPSSTKKSAPKRAKIVKNPVSVIKEQSVVDNNEYHLEDFYKSINHPIYNDIVRFN